MKLLLDEPEASATVQQYPSLTLPARQNMTHNPDHLFRAFSVTLLRGVSGVAELVPALRVREPVEALAA